MTQVGPGFDPWRAGKHLNIEPQPHCRHDFRLDILWLRNDEVIEAGPTWVSRDRSVHYLLELWEIRSNASNQYWAQSDLGGSSHHSDGLNQILKINRKLSDHTTERSWTVRTGRAPNWPCILVQWLDMTFYEFWNSARKWFMASYDPKQIWSVVLTIAFQHSIIPWSG